MASYQSGFDAPPRPGLADSRGRRLGTYMQTGHLQDHREADIAHISGQMEQRRGNTHPQPRMQQTTIARPSMRSPSPSTRAMTEPRPVGTGSRFGFGKPSVPVPTLERRQPQPVPQLKGKSSRNVLRRKQSSVAQAPGNPRSAAERSGSASPSKWSQVSAENRPSIEASLKSAEAYNEIFTRNRVKTPVNTDSPVIIPEFDRYRPKPEHGPLLGKIELPPKLSTTDLPPPTPLLSGTPLYSGSSSSHHRYSGYSGSGYSASPSTRFSESPGPGAAYSRDTTPTSMSSQSPGIIAPIKPITPRLRQGSPAQTRPPVTRRRAGSNANESDGQAIDPHGLPSLRESLTSSSSNSTVKGERKGDETKEKKKKKRLSPLPPSPPPRKSSQKFKKPRSDTQESPSKPSQAPAKPVMVSPVKTIPVKKQTAAPVQAKNIPPSRPSREGAPDLQSPAGESIAVIQSNLSGLTFSQERRQSGLIRASPLQPQIPRSAQGSRLPSRNPSPSPIQASPRLGTPAPAGLGIVPDLRPQPTTLSKGSGLRTPSPSTATKPRFGLFGRRTKTAPEVPTVDNVREKVVRKGPAAGTGHEGYGRYSARGRSTSTGGQGRSRERSMSAASSSQESISSTVTHDPFLLQRMSPVIIAGGEVIENRNASSELSRSESNTSLLLDRGRPSIESKGSSKSSLGHEAPRNTLWPSAMPREPVKRGSMMVVPKGRRPSDSSDDVVTKSSLAFRRSIQRLNSSTTALQLPKALNIPVTAPGASMTSLDTSIVSDESQQEIAAEQRGRKVLITKSKKLEKRPKSPRKWNFFHRSQPKQETKPEPSVSVTLGRPPVKPIPHYALLDGSSDEMPDYMEGMDLEDILRDAEVVDLSNEELDLLQFGEMKANLQRERDQKMKEAKAQEEKLPTLLFASPEPMGTPSETSQKELHLSRDEVPMRPSRLPQVGRIPKVISARPQATSPKSFSRPFARLSLVQPLTSPVVLDKESVALGASPPKSSTPVPEPPRMDLQTVITSEMRKGSTDSRSDTRNSTIDFLAFSPPRKGSEATSSSSGGLSFVGTTAVIPEADAELVEDEVWDEYDDLIETSDSTKDIPVPISATSSHGIPFQYESYESRRMRKSKVQVTPKESPTLASAPKIGELKIDTGDQMRGSFLTSSSVYSTDMSPRVKESLAALPSPQTPLSFSDFFSGYGDRNNSISASTPGKSTTEPATRSQSQEDQQRPRRGSRGKSNDSSSGSGGNGHNRSLSGLMTITEQTHQEISSLTPIEQVNLRVGSMTVSKWLTFGHVLFSPGREVVAGASAKRQSVLVIDGLGNDDWSFYASETYPHLKINNLSPTPAPPSSIAASPPTTSTFPLTPPNHTQIQHPPLSQPTPFPFPSSTFSVVVFRFPSSLPRHAYSHIISEAKRVLVPGGYLELAVLDLDMVNMGPRTRRAVRGVKMRLAGDVNRDGNGREKWTGSAADLTLRLVGEKGFVGVKSCCVGVPVASLVSSSLPNTQSHSQSETMNRGVGQRSKGREKEREREIKPEPSLADLMKTPSSDVSADEGIAKMVSRVGRWWYERCYEDGERDEPSQRSERYGSIFEDDNLLRECEEWNSSFKLLVAHARRPVVARRRTLSA